MSVDHFHDYLINFGIAVKNFCYTVVLLVGDAYSGKLRANDGIQQHTQPFSIRFDDYRAGVVFAGRKCEQMGILWLIRS